MAPILRVRDLYKSFGGEPILEAFDVDVDPGEAVALVGPNGAGKTTALRAIAGRTSADSGRVRVGGLSVDEDLNEFRRRLVYVSDTPVLFDDLTLGEHMDFMAAVFDVDDAEAKSTDLIERFRLSDRVDDLPTTFSRGMRQRAQLCTAFLRPSKVMLIDEPFVGLDPTGMRTLVDLFNERKRSGTALFVATHVMSSMEQFCDRVVVLADGIVIRDDTVESLLQLRGSRGSSFDEIFVALLDSESDEDAE